MWGTKQYSTAGPLEQGICVQVRSGSNMRVVSNFLETEGAITSGSIFRIGADYSGRAGNLKAGSFLVPAGSSMEEIVDIVTRGGANTCGTEVVYRVGVTRNQVEVRELDPTSNRFVEVARFNPTVEEAPAVYAEVKKDTDTQYSVVIAEGVTSWQVLTSLSEIESLEADVTEVPAEGLLAPDSYDFSPGEKVSVLLDKMEASQRQTLTEAWADRVDGLPFDTLEEALILASIIEKETGVPEERRQVASVFVNRMRLGMRMQTDPSVIYGITKGEGVLGRGLRQSELRAETPYNTYVIPGLPPTPIANPGKASIEAALDPDTTDYIFFVADGTGGHAFAVTLAEHNANVSKWREIEAQRNNN